jgi:hypothetical protein
MVPEALAGAALIAIVTVPPLISAYMTRNGNPSTEPTGTVAPAPALQPVTIPPPPPLVATPVAAAPPPSVAAAPAATTALDHPGGPATTPASLSKGRPVVAIDASQSPQAAQHVDDLKKQVGKPLIGYVDRPGAADRRKANMKGVPTVAGKDRDEAPPAVINVPGVKTSVRHIDSGDNRRAGQSIGQQLKGVPDGTKVELTTTSGSGSK